jgi:hypothetical protein
VQSSLTCPIVNLDTITTSVIHRLLKKHPELYRNRAPYLLKELLVRFLWVNRFDIYRGSPWDAWAQASHTTLATKVGLKSREWVCTLVKLLRELGWIITAAPRKDDGKQESTTFRPGPLLRQFLKTLLEAKKRENNRVNSPAQVFPNSRVRETTEAKKQTDSPIPSGLVDGLVHGLADHMSLLKKIGR